VTTHTMFDGRLQVYRRADGKTWQCAARVGGERFRESTRETELARAKDVAEEWYLDLRGRLRNGEIIRREKTFGEAAQHYMGHARVLAASTRSPAYVKNLELRMNASLLPFFEKVPLSKVNRGLVMEYRVKRMEETIAKRLALAVAGAERKAKKLLAKANVTEEQRAAILKDCEREKAEAKGKPLSRSSNSQELVHIRQVLKHAEGLGWIDHVPSLDMPYKSQSKRERRAWFSPEEYKQLYTATNAKKERPGRNGWGPRYADLHDMVLFMANSGLRPDELLRLEIRDVVIEWDPATRKDILVIDVRGKTGTGYCVTMPGAVEPFRRAVERRTQEARNPSAVWKRRARSDRPVKHRPEPLQAEPRELLPTDRLFPNYCREAFNAILLEQGLKHDRDGRVRTLYSLRHTYISMRLMEGANIVQIANNCRTSVQMIEQFYAAHIKDRLDTRTINVQRPRAAREASKRSRTRQPMMPGPGAPHPPN
jgi:integrase